ncbi:MAG: peptidoglycan-binding domain-containing protein [Methylovirgula sp.]
MLQLVQRVAAYPNRIAGAIIAALVVAISVNALELQQTRHPAPLFHKSFVAPVVALKAPRKPQFASVASAPFDPIGQLLRSTSATPQRATPSGQTSQDPIAQLLKRETPQTAPQPSKTIFALQRALVKLGFVLKPDGIDGDATRQAIEQFERDHGLPVHGALSPKVLHELSVRSGINID